MGASMRQLAIIPLLLIQTIRAFQGHPYRGAARPRRSLQNNNVCLFSVLDTNGFGIVDKNVTEVSTIQLLQDETKEIEIADELQVTIQTSTEAKAPVDSSYKFTPSDPSEIQEHSKRELRFRTTYRDLSKAAIIGLASGVAISLFKLAIEAVTHLFYSNPALVARAGYRALVPILGGLLVGLTSLPGKFPPGLSDVLIDVDRESERPVRSFQTRMLQQLNSFRKSAAAAITLGTGCSLGPEGPCVELGMSVARSCMDLQANSSRADRLAWNRLLLSCGAASGVAAGFNAPLSGILFAIEVVRNSFRKSEQDEATKSEAMLSAPSTIAPVVVSSVLAALVTQRLVGSHEVLHLSHYALHNILAQIPLYAVLGTLCGFVAFEFNQFSKLSKGFFEGIRGPGFIQSFMKRAPSPMKPMMGGIVCGLLGLLVPGVLFVGYDSINALLNDGAMSTTRLVTLLLAKGLATAISGGSGLVGGTFAPSLFLGAMTGASFHNVISSIFAVFVRSTGLFSSFLLSDLPGYTLVGAASVLAALFRAPLTATMLLFELTHDYKVLLPLMVSAGIGSVVRDVLEAKASGKQIRGATA